MGLFWKLLRGAFEVLEALGFSGFRVLGFRVYGLGFLGPDSKSLLNPTPKLCSLAVFFLHPFPKAKPHKKASNPPCS